MYKQHDHEGGISVPLIVRWPALIRDHGALTGQLAHVIDLMPTFLDAAGLEWPKEFEGRRVHAPDGRSLLPVLQGRTREPPAALYWRWSRGRAIRQRRWKLVGIRNGPWELYDVESDGTELENLAARHPKRVAALDRLWREWDAGSDPSG